MKPKELFKKAKKQKRSILTLEESRKVLEYYKIPLAKSEMVESVEEALAVAKKIKYPVVLKIVSPQVVHKTDVGGLVVDIKDDAELQNAYKQVMNNVKKKIPKAKIDGMLIQKMLSDGQQVIVGGKKDPQFNQVLMFGLGGIFTEVFDDVTFRVVPLKQADAVQMMKEIKGYKIIEGYRGKKYDLKTLASVLLKTSKLLEENQEIVELDINPLFVLTKGAFAVDARIVIG